MSMTMKVRAAVARANEPLIIDECELSGPGLREVLVRVEACGVCHTDLSAHDGLLGTPLPAVLGHEGVGRIIAVGEGVTKVTPGDRVVMSFGACGVCPNCKVGAPAYCYGGMDLCMLGRRMDGTSPMKWRGAAITGHYFGQSSFATLAVAAAENVVKVPDDLPIALLAPLGCGVQTGMGSVINVLDVKPEDSIGVFGCGTVGLSAIMGARIAGCKRIVAIDLLQSRLDVAVALGATHTIDASHEDVGATLRKMGRLTCGFDNTGVVSVIETALKALRPRGRMVLAGLSKSGAKIEIDLNQWMLTGRSLRGTVEGDANPREFIPQMIEWYRCGQLPLEKIVTTYPFEHIHNAMADMRSAKTIKPVLIMPSES